ncbi:low molecular weight phosphatase family protein [Halobacteriales archaeon QS_8_65_32]|nr:MAG: low molecular weight phosphatase family protein [Halobacteriales archaeon QS_8_65_32]
MIEARSVRVGFVCVRNAGRSQMASAFAERERAERGLEGSIEVVTGGTHPAETVHEAVVTVMHEVGIDPSDREPREITTDELESCNIVATMGCSTLDVSEAESSTDVRDWALDDPAGEGLDTVREIRDEIETRVRDLFDELDSEAGEGSEASEKPEGTSTVR